MWETTMRVERSEVVAGEPGKMWSLLSSPEAWSLWPGASFMFAVPGAGRPGRAAICPQTCGSRAWPGQISTMHRARQPQH